MSKNKEYFILYVYKKLFFFLKKKTQIRNDINQVTSFLNFMSRIIKIKQ
jgi:hypothetical protein